MTTLDKTVAPEIAAAIDAQHELMRLAYETADAAALANDYFTADAWVVGSDDMTWRGREGMMALYKDIVGTYRWKTERESLIQLSDTAVMEFLIGTITPVKPGDETLVYKIQFIWTLEDGAWKCASQFFAFGTSFTAQ
ncbi:nuclear transport factor 2 family protein [Poseidonocella sp. HB161398]|uniref:DUF4440 domain-containing protein n=1 Tax=Poseidonocella sp. HB161398 TaxID=2320855 RepID=UPI00110A019B|nr:nuclear transport factor 2 family protein [Poseidonocella sp. HB161398]